MGNVLNPVHSLSFCCIRHERPPVLRSGQSGIQRRIFFVYLSALPLITPLFMRNRIPNVDMLQLTQHLKGRVIVDVLLQLIIWESFRLVFLKIYPVAFWYLLFGGVILGVVVSVFYFRRAEEDKSEAALKAGIITMLIVFGSPLIFIVFGVLFALLLFGILLINVLIGSSAPPAP